MRTHQQIWIITKTIFKAWVRYPENTVGTAIYLGIVGLFAYVLMLSGLLLENAIPYYIVGLVIYGIIGQVNAVYLNFSLWREELLARPIKSDIFLLGVYMGSSLTNSLPMLILFGGMLPFYWSTLHIFPTLLILSLLLGILSSIGISYFFASIGLRFRAEGFVVTTLTFLFSFFCGILIPIYIIPKPLVYISYAIPYTWAIDLFRYSLLSTQTLLPVSTELVILLGSTLLYLLVGKLLLMHTFKIIRIKKVIIK